MERAFDTSKYLFLRTSTLYGNKSTYLLFHKNNDGNKINIDSSQKGLISELHMASKYKGLIIQSLRQTQKLYPLFIIIHG